MNSVADLTHFYLRFKTNHRKQNDRFVIFGTEDVSSKVNNGGVNNKMKDGTTEIEMDCLPPIWVDKYVEALEELSRVKEILSHIQKTQKKRLICVLEDKAMRTSENEIDYLTNAVHSSFKRIERLLQYISEDGIENCSLVNCSKYNKILRKNAETNVITRLGPLINQLKLMQKNYMTELKTNSTDVIPYDVHVKSHMQELQSGDQILLTKSGDVEEIIKITRKISELHSIFKEVLSIVIEQGSLVDRIDYNVDNSLCMIQNAHRQVIRMEQNSEKRIFRKIIKVLSVLIVVELVILIFKVVH